MSDAPTGLWKRNLATLDPGYFALVMATGIVSLGTALAGHRLISQVIFGFAVAGYVLLAVAYLARLVWYRSWVTKSLRDPTTAMAYFTVVAGTDVLAARTAVAGHDTVVLALAAAAALLWLALTYGLPWSIVAAARRPVLGEINGTWLVWVVATQSLSIAAAAAAPALPGGWSVEIVPAVAASLWAVGVMLYLILIVIIFLRLLVIEVTPAEMGPAYWIAMGAAAISVRAAAGVLALTGGTHPSVVVSALRPLLIGLSFVLWAWGTWWIPLLILLGIWRYLVRGYPRTYEPRLWNVVFPLGMYSVASLSLGRAAHFSFMVTVATAWVWVGVAAWVTVLSLTVYAGLRAVRPGPTPPPPPG